MSFVYIVVSSVYSFLSGIDKAFVYLLIANRETGVLLQSSDSTLTIGDLATAWSYAAGAVKLGR